MFSAGIVVSSWHYFSNPFKLQPLNELYFATVLDDRFQGDQVKIDLIDLRDTRLPEFGMDIENVAPSICEHDLFLYWIAKTADFNEVASVVKQLRLAYPKAKHAAGGTHADNFPDQCKNIFDAVVLGPGEESFVEIINDIRNNSLKKEYLGDWSKSNYDDYPIASRHYLPERSIVNTELFEQYGGERATSAMFSRGCNFKCAFCVYNVPSYIQRRSPKAVEKEIGYLKKTYKLGAVNLRDEIAIPVSRKDSIPFLEALGRMNIIWRGQTRTGADREVISMARESGCVELAVGVESASQQVLNIIRKGQNIKRTKEFIANCKQAGIKIKMCLILGLPGEPENIVELSRSLIEESRPDFVNISGFCPVPGSEIFRNQEHYGIQYIDEDWSKHAHLLYRFSDDEHFGLPFEYAESNRWGKTFSKKRIIKNIQELQHYLRHRDMSY